MKAYITARLTQNVLKELKKLIEITYEPWTDTGEIYFDAKELAGKLEGYDIFITELDDLKKKEFFENTNIKFLISCRGDPFNINLEAATKKGIPVLNTPMRNVDAVADLTVCYILMLARNIHKMDRLIHSEEFEINDFEDWIFYYQQFKGIELGNKIVGIIGLGQIGRRVANRLKPFGVSIYIYDPFIPAEISKQYGEPVELDFLMRNCDFITIHAVATEENDNLINEERINMMKSTAFLINTSKGSLIDYDALFEALEEKRIAGAALDVFPLEPIDEDNEFLELDNVIVSPHIGGNTYEVVERQSQMILKDIKLWLEGKIPTNIMNPEVLKDQIKIEKKANIQDLKQKIVDLCQKLLEEGHIVGSAGNVSIRVRENDKQLILITPSNVNYKDMSANDILIIDINGNIIEGNRNPSIEKNMHLKVYKEREDINAIIHAHSIFSTILSTLKYSIPPIIEELIPYVGGEIMVAEYAEAGSEELAENVLKQLGDKNAVLLANHGNLCCGSHLEGAYTVLTYVERAAKIYYMAKIIGDPNLLPEDTVDYEKDIFELFKEDGKI
ncbi:MAG: NAD(P)-dependent oxidoreductase [Promethearchaeota archaeon]